jgi:hypothetical protein
MIGNVKERIFRVGSGINLEVKLDSDVRKYSSFGSTTLEKVYCTRIVLLIQIS